MAKTFSTGDEGAHSDAEISALHLRISALTDALRKVAVFHRYRSAEGGGAVFVGSGCEVCDAECGPEQMIVHVGDCPLTVLNPST